MMCRLQSLGGVESTVERPSTPPPGYGQVALPGSQRFTGKLVRRSHVRLCLCPLLSVWRLAILEQ